MINVVTASYKNKYIALKIDDKDLEKYAKDYDSVFELGEKLYKKLIEEKICQ